MRRMAMALVLALAVGGLAGSAPASASSHEWTYVEMSDGVKIAVSVRYPAGFSDQDEDKWPTIFQMDGYAAGGSGGMNPASYGDNYVTVHASIRGTGCSGGRFELFDRRHAEDGYEIIEDWIVKQPWSNGRVGIVGYSYSGLTGFLVGSTAPPSVKAIGLGGLIDDLYRGIVYPGGVPNFGFPAIWTGAYRPAAEHSGNAGRYQSETTAGDPRCATNIATRPPRDVFEEPMIRGAQQQEDGPWWQLRSLHTWADRISAPIHVAHHYQDEQTGPRGGHRTWELIPESTPKRLVMTNGRHGMTAAEFADRVAWLDCWILNDGQDCAGDIADPDARVKIFFETTGNQSTNPPLTASDFPIPETEWTRYFLHADGTATAEGPAADEAARVYVSPPRGRQAGDVNPVTSSTLPDELVYTLDFEKATAIAGPITMNLSAQTTSTDADFFVTLIDERPDGSYEYLQRGLLRASHRAIDELRSDRIDDGAFAGTIYRPHRPHTNPQPVVPGEVVDYLIEVFPVGHVFREGHRLVIKVSNAPATDPVSEIYMYPSPQAPQVVFVHHDAARPSSILLPVLPDLPAVSATAPACGAQSGVRCTTPLL